ncbi:DUF1190 domain-containing protein [Dyella subtropica]|uniref:DUF1190 domain-containing protein n=1 Tax=Dyella subtropica TaxID=2992127 RepID=UPI0022598986|nr:DUF1190 domain-containing protein [Dyella subtropica]
MKRSTTAKLLLMGLSPLMLTACGDSAPEASVKQQNFTTVADCTKAGVPQDECQRDFDRAQANADASAPHFKTREDCIRDYGADMCQERHSEREGSFWGPLMTGFMVSQLLHSGSPSYQYAGPLYRQRDGRDYSPYSWSSSYGGGSSRSSGSGSTTGGAEPAGSRAITASRGGFGSSSAAAGSWGS